VTLLERGERLGGQLLLAGSCHGRQEMSTMLADLERQLETQPVEVRLQTDASPDAIKSDEPDVVIVATGARPLRPELEGAELPHVVQAWDVLAGRARVGREVVVVGGGAVAVDVALDLAQRGTLDGETLKFLLLSGAEDPDQLRERCLVGAHRVTMVEMRDKLGKGIGRTTRWTLMQALRMQEVTLLERTHARRIEERGVWVEREGEGEERLLSADTVVLAMGAEPCAWLGEALDGQIEVLTVGDAKSPRRAFEAIHEGFQAGMSV
jgi:2,4-dienoyl-CoA reductase (NADPH2)